MDKRKSIFWEVVLLIGLMLTGCAGYQGGYGQYDHPYNDYGYGNYGSHYYREYRGGW